MMLEVLTRRVDALAGGGQEASSLLTSAPLLTVGKGCNLAVGNGLSGGQTHCSVTEPTTHAQTA